jgi:hypothetical protein
MEFVARNSLFAVTLGVATAAACAPGFARPHSTDPMDWLIQHICADKADKPVPADPYDGCPAGTSERRLKLGEPLPYYRHDEPDEKHNRPLGLQRRDNYPLIDRHYGGVFAANDFDFDIFGPYRVFRPGDGFDVYRVVNGYVTGGGTRDGGGYSSSFFGADCKPFGGWGLFPVSFLKSLRPGAEGRGVFPIRGVYWEQRGEAWPGKCEPDKGFSRNTLTTWSFEANHVFGGLYGTRQIKLDTIISTHGLPTPLDPQRHHLALERFYFTDMYGTTRWETWVSSEDKPTPANNCSGPTTMTYEGREFTLAACRDSSQVEIYDPPQPRAPWPYPETNLLADWHFTNEELSPWRIEGGALTARLMNSRSELDMLHAPTGGGVRYLQIDCAEAASDCGGSVYQDLALKGLPATEAFDYGFSGVVSGEGEGSVEVSLSQRDAEGRSLWETHFTAKLTDKFYDKRAADSVFRSSSTFLTTTPEFRVKPDAAALRLTLSPKTPRQYDILDTWVMPR